VRIRHDPTFGDWIDLRPEIPAGTDGILVAANDGYGRRPLRLLLPHQVYVRDLLDYVRKRHPSLPRLGAESFEVYPIDRSKWVSADLEALGVAGLRDERSLDAR
jgi:hypothetical protein